MRNHRLYVLESLQPQDRSSLVEDLANVAIVKPWFTVKRVQVSGAEELFSSLAAIRCDVSDSDMIPWIHIEAHGSPTGLVTHPSNQEVLWQDLREPLTQVNVQAQNRLLLTLGTCWGENIYRTLDMKSRSPFEFYIAPRDTILTREVESAFYTFYSELVTTQDVELAVRRSRIHNGVFSIVSSEQVLDMLVQMKADDLALDKIDLRLHEGYLKVTPSGLCGEKWPLSEVTMVELRLKYARSWLDNITEMCDRFLMLDLYPDSIRRYQVPIRFAEQLMRNGGMTLIASVLGEFRSTASSR